MTRRRMHSLLRGAGSILEFYPDPDRYSRFVPAGTAEESRGEIWHRVGRYIHDAAERVHRESESRAHQARASRKKSRPPVSAKAVYPDRPEGSAQLVAEVLREERQLSGPLPPPEVLRGYDDVLPGAAERILRMAEIERMAEIDQLAIREAVAVDRRRRRRYAFLVALAALVAACFLGYQGLEVAAAIVGGGTVVGLVTAFIASRRRERA